MREFVLPCTIGPKKDELLSSWLVRLSYRHQLKVHTFGQLVFPKINIWNRDIDKLAPDTILKTLSEKTFTDRGAIDETTLKSYEGRLYRSHNSYGNTRWLLPLGIYHRTRKNYGLLFCAGCLKKDSDTPYFRKQWRLSFSVVCPDCGLFLMDRCAACGEPVVFFRSMPGKNELLAGKALSHCHKCGFDLTESKTISAPGRFVYQQRKLYRILSEGWKKEVFYPHLFFDVLHQLLNILAGSAPGSEKLRNDLSTRFKHAGLLEAVLPGHVGFDKLPLQSRMVCLRQAMWLLDKNGENLLYLSRYHNLSSSIFFKDMDQVPFWYHELIVSNFFGSNVNRRFKKSHFRKDELNLVMGPVNGLCGPKRKYSKEYCCLACGSDWVIKDGHKRGRQMMKCRSCTKRFAI